MSTMLNDRDVLLRAGPRNVNAPGAGVLLVASTPAFHVNTSGVADPVEIKFRATRVGNLIGAASFIATGGTVTVAGDEATLTYPNMPGATASVLARVTANGQTFDSNICTVGKVVDGVNGATAKTLELGASSQVFQINKSGASALSSINLTAKAQNLTGTPNFTIPSSGATLTAGADAYNKVLTLANMTADSVTFRVDQDGQFDTITIIKVREGSDAVNPNLTNESANVAATSAGVVGSFTGAGGTFKLYDGAVDMTGNAAVTYSVFSETGVDVSIAATGVYSVASMSADTGTAILRAVYKGITYDKIYSISKTKQGIQGGQGIQGDIGPNGAPTYIWIKYADVADGTNLYDTANANTQYIGIAPNKTVQAESTNKADYVWSKFRGEAGVDGVFAPKLSWDFRNSLDGWSNGGVGAATLAPGADAIWVTSSGVDPIIYSPGISVSGALYDKVRMRVRRTSGTSWDGQLFYWNERHTDDGSYKIIVPDTTKLNEWVILDWDMSKTLNNDWGTSTITRLRVDLGASASDAFDIDWICVGKYGPTASLESVAAAQAAADAANARVANISANGVLDRSEKPAIVLEWHAIYNEYAGIVAQAQSVGVSTPVIENYQNNYAYLDAYLVSIDYANTTADSAIVRDTFNFRFEQYYADRQTLINASTAKAATISTWTGTVGRPDDGNNLLRKSRFDDGLLGGWANGSAVVNVSGQPFTKALQFTSRDCLHDEGTAKIAVIPGETLYFDAYLDASTTTFNIRFGAFVYNRDGAIILYGIPVSHPAGAGWARKTAPFVVPADAYCITPWLQIDASGSFGSARASNLRISRFQSGSTAGAPAGSNVGNTDAALIEARANAALPAAPGFTLTATVDDTQTAARNTALGSALTASSSGGVAPVKITWGFTRGGLSNAGFNVVLASDGSAATVTCTSSIAGSLFIGVECRSTGNDGLARVKTGSLEYTWT